MDISVTSRDGTRLALRRAGHGTPVVGVHGSSGGLDSWDPVARHLTDEFELWTYARRGYIPSDAPTGPHSYADDVDDLLTVLDRVRDETGVRPQVLAGSHGGNIALHSARTKPDAVPSLALFEPSLYAAGPQLSPVLDELRSLLDQERLGPAARLFAEQVAQMPTELLDAVGVGTEPTGTQRAAELVMLAGCRVDLEAMAADDGDMNRWQDVTVPTLVVQGELTWSPMPETLDRLIEALAAPQRVVLGGQMHFATHTAPEVVAAAVAPFLREHS